MGPTGPAATAPSEARGARVSTRLSTPVTGSSASTRPATTARSCRCGLPHATMPTPTRSRSGIAGVTTTAATTDRVRSGGLTSATEALATAALVRGRIPALVRPAPTPTLAGCFAVSTRLSLPFRGTCSTSTPTRSGSGRRGGTTAADSAMGASLGGGCRAGATSAASRRRCRGRSCGCLHEPTLRTSRTPPGDPRLPARLCHVPVSLESRVIFVARCSFRDLPSHPSAVPLTPLSFESLRRRGRQARLVVRRQSPL
jgi:hypothetical protein